MQCPICQKQFEPPQTTAMPFCSSRCRQIDLGRWLDEDYGLPWEGDEEEDFASQPSERQHESDAY